MKKRFFVVTTLMIIGLSLSHSQLIQGYGIKAGVASTNQNCDWTGVTTNTSARQGLDAGVFVEWLDIPLLSVVTEIHYIQKTSEVTTDIIRTIVSNSSPNGYIDMGYYSFTPRLDYLSISLLMKLRFDLPALSIYLLAGPRIDILLSEHGDDLPVNSNDFQKENIGGTFGIGLATLSLASFNIGAEFRYSPDFQKSYSKNYLTINNQSMEFLLVVGF